MTHTARLLYIEKVLQSADLGTQYRDKQVTDPDWCDALGRRIGWPDRPKR